MISFTSQALPFPEIDMELIRNWIGMVADIHHYDVGRLSYLFCDDEYILDANRKFLQHDYYTDIITFDSSRDPEYAPGDVCVRRGRIAGDMIISLDTVRTNAEKVGCAYEHELHRVIIHGVLHLCGIDDKGPGEREIMEGEENKALDLLSDLGGVNCK